MTPEQLAEINAVQDEIVRLKRLSNIYKNLYANPEIGFDIRYRDRCGGRSSVSIKSNDFFRSGIKYEIDLMSNRIMELEKQFADL